MRETAYFTHSRAGARARLRDRPALARPRGACRAGRGACRSWWRGRRGARLRWPSGPRRGRRLAAGALVGAGLVTVVAARAAAARRDRPRARGRRRPRRRRAGAAGPGTWSSGRHRRRAGSRRGGALSLADAALPAPLVAGRRGGGGRDRGPVRVARAGRAGAALQPLRGAAAGRTRADVIELARRAGVDVGEVLRRRRLAPDDAAPTRT